MAGIVRLLPELLREAAVEADDWNEQLLASLSCRAAIKKGRSLTLSQARDLVTRLGTTLASHVSPRLAGASAPRRAISGPVVRLGIGAR